MTIAPQKGKRLFGKSGWMSEGKGQTDRPQALKIERCQGCLNMPSEIISVVAPAGGCGDLNRTINPAVSPRESAAAITRGHVTPTVNAGPVIVKPVTTRLK